MNPPRKGTYKSKVSITRKTNILYILYKEKIPTRPCDIGLRVQLIKERVTDYCRELMKNNLVTMSSLPIEGYSRPVMHFQITAKGSELIETSLKKLDPHNALGLR